jgi:hypothetical protein
VKDFEKRTLSIELESDESGYTHAGLLFRKSLRSEGHAYHILADC